MSLMHSPLDGLANMRALVRESWQRSLAPLSTPAGLSPPVVWENREHRHLLWVVGESAARRNGENINVATGANCSEPAAGKGTRPAACPG